MKLKKIALFLVFVMIAASIAGCSKSNGQGTTKDSTKQEKQQGKVQGEEKAETAKMGRFMEKDVSFPKLEENETVINIIENSSKQIELYTHLLKNGKTTYTCYQLQNDMAWKSSEPGWLNDGTLDSKNVVIGDLCYGQDGNYYACYMNYNVNVYHILKSEDGGKTAKELKIPYLTEATTNSDGSKSYPMIIKMNVLKNGNLVMADLQASSELQVFTPAGEKQLSIPVESYDQASVSFQASGNQVITKNENGKGIILYDTETKKTVRSIDYEEKKNITVFAQKEDGTLLMADTDGIHRLTKNGSLWETTVDGALNSMNMPSLYLDEIFVTEGEEEEYYISYLDSDEGHMLKHYVYDKNVSSVPEKEITVYSLQENSTVRQAVSLYQSQNADTKVNYVVAMGEEGGTLSDYIRALNTELLAGNGADVLVLDGLPIDSYIEKGVLADLSDIIKPMEDSGKLLSNVSNCYVNDSKIYQMPLRVNVPIFAAKKDGLSTIENMDSILSYIQNSKLPYSSTATYKGLLENYLALYSSDLYQDGKLDESKMKVFLENLKKIADNIKATEYAEGEDKSSNSTDDLYDYTRLFRNELIGFAYGKYSTAMDQVSDYLSLAIMISATEENHSSFASMNQMFIPKGLIGLNSKSKETATAKKFIQFLFSNDVQKTNLYEGFPINTESLKVWTAEEREDESYGFGNDEGTISATWPTKDQREAFEKILLSVNKPINLNQVINNMIINESLPYFTGDIDAGQAANAAISKINTYLAE